MFVAILSFYKFDLLLSITSGDYLLLLLCGDLLANGETFFFAFLFYVDYYGDFENDDDNEEEEEEGKDKCDGVEFLRVLWCNSTLDFLCLCGCDVFYFYAVRLIAGNYAV